jgi:sugar phosphate isomerase/epimerase
MQRLLSTYLWINHKLTTNTLEETERAGISGVEIFCGIGHFDYRSAEVVRDFSAWFAAHELKLHSLHAPTSRDFSPGREGGSPVSISDPERVRRTDAVDEIKRALEFAERTPFQFMVLHAGTSRDSSDPRHWDAAFSSLEHLALFARHRSVTLALENTPGELATPGNLRKFLEDVRMPGLQLCFDAGHANLESNACAALETMRGFTVTAHLHDNHGEKDEHLLPFEGTINWKELLRGMPADLPGVIELKERGPNEPSLDAIRAAFDALDEARENP